MRARARARERERERALRMRSRRGLKLTGVFQQEGGHVGQAVGENRAPSIICSYFFFFKIVASLKLDLSAHSEHRGLHTCWTRKSRHAD